MDKALFHIQYEFDDLARAVEKYWVGAGQFRIHAFYGSMGAGKTTFIGALCRHLGVAEHVSSPTFSIINEYSIFLNGQMQQLFHLDCYRIGGYDEAIRAGIEDALLNFDAYCFVEWPERIENILPRPHIATHMLSDGNQRRSMSIIDVK